MGKSKQVNCTVGNPELLSRNGEGYVDKTAYEAILNLDEPSEEETERFNMLIRILRGICDLAGFRIEGKITLIDNETERKWRR